MTQEVLNAGGELELRVVEDKLCGEVSRWVGGEAFELLSEERAEGSHSE
jgi:hypothetical protein